MKKILLAVLLAISVDLFADHIVGGYMYYECLGNDDYKVTLKMYRDCKSAGAPYYNIETLYIYYSNNVIYQSIVATLDPTSRDTLPFTLTDSCLTTNASICVEQASYTAIVNLPPPAGGLTYYVSFQRCCRSAAINNILTPNQVGSTFYVDIPSSPTLLCNTSPAFIENNPVALCAGYPFSFNSGATDLDGDSLVYSFVNPYGGGSQGNVVPNNPVKNFPPITWAPGYSTSAQISCDASNPLAINSSTGIITGTPNQQGYFVVSVQILEYRDGVPISAVTRDFQFQIVSCTQANASTSINNICYGGTYGSVNVTVGGGNAPYSYTWMSTTDTILASNVAPGPYAFDSLTAGTYTVNVSDAKGCYSQTPVTITQDPYKTNFKSITVCLNDTAPLITTPSDLVSSHQWYFNNDTVANVYGGVNDTLRMPVSSGDFGAYTDSIRENSTGCMYRYIVTVIQATVNGSVSSSNLTCIGSNDGIASISGVTNNSNIPHSYTYSWSSLPVQNAATATNLPDGTYTVTLNYGGCVKIDSVTIGVKPFPTTTQTSTACASDTVRLISLPSSSIHQWYSPTGSILGTNDTLIVINPAFNSSYIDTITTPVNSADCQSRIVHTITQQNITATTSQIPVSCYMGSNGTVFASMSPFIAPHQAYQYTWSNGTTTMTGYTVSGLTSGTYTLIVSSGGCIDTATVTVTQPTAVKANYTVNNVRCDSLRIGSIIAAGTGGTPGYTYTWTGLAITGSSVSALEQGVYNITVHDSKGCTLVDSVTVAEDFVAPDTSLVSVRFCHEDQTAILEADSGYLAYQWYDQNGVIISGATSQQYVVAMPQPNQHYSVTLTPVIYGCKQSIDIDMGYYLKTELPDYVPVSNIFTPNADGQNDEFDLTFKYVQEFDFKVYDRWGRLVYESLDMTNQWNGKDKNGKNCDNGVYYWIVSYLPSCVSDGEASKVSTKGFVQLLR